jgi:hypothetical protein
LVSKIHCFIEKRPFFETSIRGILKSKSDKKTATKKQFGKYFEKDLLLNLGYAARIYPLI